MNKSLKKKIVYSLFLILFISAMILRYNEVGRQETIDVQAEQKIIKWVDFQIPTSAMSKALELDVKAHSDGLELDWVTLLAVTGTRYYGNWKSYKAADMEALAQRLMSGETVEEIIDGYKNYDYFEGAYRAVLGGFVGEFQKEVPEEGAGGGIEIEDFYGLKAYHPIAQGYGYTHYRDFDDSRSYGYRRRHTGNDLCGSVGTPIAAVEGGIIEEIGWNQYGGWRIGIRSFDGKRYYYYAHLRKGHPFVEGLKKGDIVQGGDVIGYLGMTGYSTKEDTNNMKVPHLHFGIQLIFDESQKDAPTQIWIDVYDIIELLEKSRVSVVKEEETGEYVRQYKMFDRHVAGGE